MPIVVGALGTILKELVGKIQKIALSGTARLLRRVLELRLQDVTFTGNWLQLNTESIYIIIMILIKITRKMMMMMMMMIAGDKRSPQS